MQCMKPLVQRVTAFDFVLQVAEIQKRGTILKGFTALGIPKNRCPGRRSVSGNRRSITLPLCAPKPSPL